jgi:hypothetical protein
MSCMSNSSERINEMLTNYAHTYEANIPTLLSICVCLVCEKTWKKRETVVVVRGEVYIYIYIGFQNSCSDRL